jgi:hypothetical protein
MPGKPIEYLPTQELDYCHVLTWTFLSLKTNYQCLHWNLMDMHFSIIETVERDVLKNRLCKAADLPLIRVITARLPNEIS